MSYPPVKGALLPGGALLWQSMRLFFGANLVVDMGAANTRIYVPGRGIALNEPSVIALRGQSETPVAVGRAAKLMAGRVPASIRVTRPLRDGVISDVGAATKMLRAFIRRAIGQPTLFAPRLLLCIPAVTTPLERRALEEVVKGAGARCVQFIEEPVAAAAGAGVRIESASARAVVDIGAETVDVAVMSLEGLLHTATFRTGGRAMDQAIMNFVRERYHLEIGEESAEMVKRTLGATGSQDRNYEMEVGGHSLRELSPVRVSLSSTEIQTAIRSVVTEITNDVALAFEELPPEAAADLLEAGVVLTGGAAQLPGLAEKLSEKTGLEMRLANNPALATVIGAAHIFWPEAIITEAWPLVEPIATGTTVLPD